MNEPTLAAFAMVAFVGIATPGPTVLLALAASLAAYRRSSA
jgi:threonine/homoserine/homoserine lactone efflux protein